MAKSIIDTVSDNISGIFLKKKPVRRRRRANYRRIKRRSGYYSYLKKWTLEKA